MPAIHLSATPKGNGYQATVTFPDGVSISSGLSKAWQTKIATAMKDYAATKDGQAALEAIYQISGLTDANPASLQKTQKAAASIGLG